MTLVISLIAILTGLSYWSIVPYLIRQEPTHETIIVSNLTLSYLLFYLAIGGVTYWTANNYLSRKAVPPGRRIAFSTLITLTIALVTLLALSPWYQLNV